MKMSESIFESFEAYLKEADYPKGKKKIMQAAVDLISTKSYNGTSTLQISKHAGLSQATLFKYFKTKEDLLTAIYILLFQDFSVVFLRNFWPLTRLKKRFIISFTIAWPI